MVDTVFSLKRKGHAMLSQREGVTIHLVTHYIYISGVLFSLLFLSGCSTTRPEPLTKHDVQKRVSDDLHAIKEIEKIEKIEGELTLEGAVARALKNNLDYRVKKMEAALSVGISDLSNDDMWPKLLANAGYNSRSNYSGGTSIGIKDGEESLRPSTAQERQFVEGGVEFSWNLLDFGVSYYVSKQNADKFLIAEEHKRKLTQNIIQDVRAAYWRALSAQRLEEKAVALLKLAEDSLQKSREAEMQKIVAPEVTLNFQRAILDATTKLNHHRQSLVIAKHELAGLMSIPPEVDFKLAPAEHAELPPIPNNITTLEEMALLQRPELRVTDYERRITVNESKKEALSFLPNLNFSSAIQATTNKYTFNKNWLQSSMAISWNIMKLFSREKLNKKRALALEVDNAHRLALNIAVIAQVRMAAESYAMAVKDYELATLSSDVDNKLAKYVEDAANARLQNQLEVVRTKIKALLGEYMHAHAYANAQIAFGRLYSSLGFDAIHDNYDTSSISTLADHIQQYMNKSATEPIRLTSNLFGDHENFVSIKLIGGDQKLNEKMQPNLESFLARNSIHHTSQGNDLTFKLSKQRNLNIEKATWQITLKNTKGEVVNTTSYNTKLPHDARDSTVEATLMAAATAKLNEVKGWLKKSQD